MKTLSRRGLGLGVMTIPFVANAARAASRTHPIKVATRYGQVVGKIIDHIAVFKGIPYGANTATTRFAPPRAPEAYQRPYAAFDFGASAPQAGQTEAVQSENCLFLNVFTPKCDDKRRAVMVYIHGGAYMTGSGSDALYDGTRLAATEDVVVVTLNHRLNALGYLYLGQLERQLTGTQARFAASGNVGQLDIVMALKWVRDHISSFGGDPLRVMVFGQSGGGAKIATLMAQPVASGLFATAATMSGQQVTASGPGNATKRALAVMAALGLKPNAAGLDMITSMPFAAIIDALKVTDPVIGSGGVYMGPVLDEQILFRHPFYPDVAPQSRSVPMMIGNTRDETRFFLGNDPANHSLKWEDLPQKLPAQYRVDIDPYLVIDTYRQLYPNMTASEVFFAATTAGRSWRGAIIEDEERAKARCPAFAYQLNWQSPKDGGKWGACHTMDIPLVFQTTDAPKALTGDGQGARAMAKIMGHSFASFAKTGRPDNALLPVWTPYSLGKRETMIFDLPPRLENDPRGAERQLFEKVPFVQQGT